MNKRNTYLLKLERGCRGDSSLLCGGRTQSLDRKVRVRHCRWKSMSYSVHYSKTHPYLSQISLSTIAGRGIERLQGCWEERHHSSPRSRVCNEKHGCKVSWGLWHNLYCPCAQAWRNIRKSGGEDIKHIQSTSIHLVPEVILSYELCLCVKAWYGILVGASSWTNWSLSLMYGRW